MTADDAAPPDDTGAAPPASSASSAASSAERALVRFVTRFLLPLVQGGALHVGRPLGAAAVARMSAGLPAATAGQALVRWRSPDDPVRSDDVIAQLAARRHAVARTLLAGAPVPPLDEESLRLGAALHNLLALTHPAIEGRGGEARQERIASAAAALAALGPPDSAVQAVHRHSLLGRLSEIARSDRVVHYWLGRKAFVGRVPPARMTALPRLRQVRVDVVRRGWLREIGIPACGRTAFLALSIASPLGDADDLFRLEPPLAWSRLLPVLRFPPLCRLVAGRVVDLGVERAGDALADALFRFGARQDPPGGTPADGEALAFAIRFLSHVLWLDLLFAPGRPPADGAPGVPVGAGLDLAVVLAAAHKVAPALIWPPDVAPDSALGQRFAARLAAMAERVQARRWPRFEAAVGLAGLAARAANGAVPGVVPPSPGDR